MYWMEEWVKVIDGAIEWVIRVTISRGRNTGGTVSFTPKLAFIGFQFARYVCAQIVTFLAVWVHESN